MTDHNGVLMMQRLLLAGTLGLAVARRAAAILDGEPASSDAPMAVLDGQRAPDPRSSDGAALRVILDAANECLGHFDDRPPGERWCDALLHLLDLAAFAADLSSPSCGSCCRMGTGPRSCPCTCLPAPRKARSS